MNDTGILYVVATPIGNLKDITFRAVEILSAVDIIACEDTRHTQILLKHYNIKKPLLSYFEYNKLKRIDQIISSLKDGKNIALVSDAGTPGISDPGSSLIKQVIDTGLKLEVIPGACALIAGLVVSGSLKHKFVFEGFLPVKSGARKKVLENLKAEKRSIIFYESPHRLLKTLNDIEIVRGNCSIAIARELTKKFEQIFRGTTQEAITYFTKHKPKGEFVIII
ncbi:MAG: 16S rRNA (cytidine(1402)-2'-O)-methyltransferase [Candidatus Omnitrophota bacterium]